MLCLIQTLKERFKVPTGYSGMSRVPDHLCGRDPWHLLHRAHITLGRAMWGSDHAASVGGFMHLVRDIRVIEKALRHSVKKV